MKKIAVVILNWNGVQLIEQFLPIVVQFSPEADIYVADNASSDASVSFVKKNFPSIQIINNKSNFGFAKGYNEALQFIENEYLSLLNSDVEVTKNWLQPIIETFEKEPNTAIIQPKILDFKRKDYFEYAGAAGGYIDQFGYPFCRGRLFETIEKDDLQYDDQCEIFWASGACFFVRNIVYKSLNGFDNDFFAHQEEIDLCWRVINNGHRIKYNAKSIVYHVGGATLQQGNPKKTYLNFRNSLLMLTKNLPKSTLFFILLSRLFLDGLAGIQFLFQGKFKHFIAILNAHVSFYFLFVKTYKKRNKNQISKYYKIKSIVLIYYLKNVKTFDKIV